MKKIPNLSPTERVILGHLISKGELYGLELVRTDPKRLKRGTIYVTLSRMEDKGFVETRFIKDERLPGKKRPRYSVTGLGETVFNFHQKLNRDFFGGEALA